MDNDAVGSKLQIPMIRSVSIVGAGRVGKTLARLLHRRGWRIGAVVARSEAHARAAVRWIGAGAPYGRLTPEIFDAGVILIATPDSAVAQVAASLARLAEAMPSRKKTMPRRLRDKIVLHTSGALDSRVLAPLAGRGAATGSMHPMQTFTGRESPNLKGVIFAIEGNPRARRAAQRIAHDLGATPIVIESVSKVAYHAAGALVAGHALALVEAATQILLEVGFTRHRAQQALLPLMRQMLDNFERVGPQRAWTGPISRGDFAIVSAHMKSLRRYPREFAQAYAALAQLGGRVLAKDAARTLSRLRRALK